MVEKGMIKDKRGQVMIFVVIAILIVVGVLIWFFLISPNFFVSDSAGLNFESCVNDVIEKNLEEIGKQGGYVNPESYILYGGEKIGYLCYTNLYYESCVVQKPFIKQHVEKQLETVSEEGIKRCYEDSVSELQSRGYEVVSEDIEFDILIEPGFVKTNVKAPTSISKDVTQNFESFSIKMNSNMYEILMVASSILQYEIKYGDSDVTTLMKLYDSLRIYKLKQGDGTTIYRIEDNKDKFYFASRSYAWPAGYGVNG